jgi:hypothetical protein
VKERLSDLLAWIAFVNACLNLCAMALIFGLNVAPRTPLGSAIELYFEVIGAETIGFGAFLYPAVIWMVLYVINGNPRFLPWSK